MKTLKLLPVLVAGASLLLAGCLDVGGGSEGDTTGKTLPPQKNMNLVCDALTTVSGSDFPTYQGVLANLFYLEDSQPRFTDVNDYISQGQAVTNFSIFFNTLNIPTRPFDRGFVSTSGQVIRTSRGDTLYEWFGFEFKTDLVKAPGDADGDYQLAILSDDGAVLNMRTSEGNPGTLLVDNNGQHPTRFGCGTTRVNMQQSTRIPLNIRYNQGPRYHIAMMLMWRPYPSNPALVNDVECGQEGNDRFFDSTQSPPAPQTAYNNLLARGWKPLKPENYMVPQEVQNTCNIPAPEITDVVVANLTANSVTLAWTTNIASTSQLEVYDFSTGALVAISEIDLGLVTGHNVEVTGLTPSTLYTLVPVSMSDSGKTTYGDSTVIRTRR